MDSRAAGMCLLFLPGLLFVLKPNKAVYTVIVITILLCMLMSPQLTTAWRIFSSGIGAGLFLTYFGLQLTDRDSPRVNWGKSAAMAVLASIIFRFLGNSLDYSITGNGKVIGWIIILFIPFLFWLSGVFKPDEIERRNESESEYGSWPKVLGIFSCIIFIYLVFASPGVIGRWTEGDLNKILFVAAMSILVFNEAKFSKIEPTRRNVIFVGIWNGLFVVLFIINIVIHRIAFPSLDDPTPVVVEASTEFSKYLSYLMLLLSPVIFLNLQWFTRSINPTKPSRIAPAFLVAALFVTLCIFMLIFSNTWGYVGKISRIFRNQFHLPFAIAGVVMILSYFSIKAVTDHKSEKRYWKTNIAGGLILIVLVFFYIHFVDTKRSLPTRSNANNQLTLMTYNIQQGVDLFGNKNFEGQLKRIKEIDPDILCLQESDAARISGGNSDVVRYFSEKLRYHSYYGPKTVSGTYGTAILCKFPLKDCRTVFTYSSKDEIGTAIATITFGDNIIKILNSHPAGDANSREEHIKMVIEETKEYENVIAMGDYNFRQDSPYYKSITKTLQDSWLSLYPNAIGEIDESMLDLSFKDWNRSSGQLLGNGKIDMTTRIDHIFLSSTFKVLEAQYLPAPESETDHPLYWAVVQIH